MRLFDDRAVSSYSSVPLAPTSMYVDQRAKLSSQPFACSRRGVRTCTSFAQEKNQIESLTDDLGRAGVEINSRTATEIERERDREKREKRESRE